MSMGLARLLWQASADLAEAALGHPFVRGLRDGSLALDAFQHYIAQDAYFLDAFARAYALALARSPDRHGLDAFQELLAGVVHELRLHGGYLARWGVAADPVEPSAATRAYTDFLLSTAALHGVGETCAAMTPCMRLYAFLGQSLAGGDPPPADRYGEWIRTYADPDFEALAARLEGLLDRYASDTPPIRALYRRAMGLEVAFFDASRPGQVAGSGIDRKSH
jgi:thiaminase (transcriptional activator TenA)